MLPRTHRKFICYLIARFLTVPKISSPSKRYILNSVKSSFYFKKKQNLFFSMRIQRMFLKNLVIPNQIYILYLTFSDWPAQPKRNQSEKYIYSTKLVSFSKIRNGVRNAFEKIAGQIFVSIEKAHWRGFCLGGDKSRGPDCKTSIGCS